MADTFVAGGTGFIGQRMVRALVARGDRVTVLTRGEGRRARAVEDLGARLLRGDLLAPASFRDEARAADLVVHLAQPRTFGGRVTRARALAYRAERLAMDRNLLDAVDPGRVARVVYVGGTSYYGDLGRTLAGESAAPRPRGWGPYLAPAIEQLDGYIARGLPIVTAFPGYVYGDGSWFREYVIRPLRSGKRLNAIAGRSRVASPIHVEDCARALVHLLDHGAVGQRYFVVDDEPLEWARFYARAAEAMGAPLRLRKVPSLVLRLLVGSLVVESLLSDAALSNRKLKALGFSFAFPTSATGIPDVIANARP